MGAARVQGLGETNPTRAAPASTQHCSPPPWGPWEPTCPALAIARWEEEGAFLMLWLLAIGFGQCALC